MEWKEPKLLNGWTISKNNENLFVLPRNEIILQGKANKIFPLFTKQSLANRWGVDRQTVQNWSARHNDFCEPFDGLVSGSGTYYPLYEVERYEQIRGLNRG